MELARKIVAPFVGALITIGIACAVPATPAAAATTGNTTDTSYYFEFNYFGDEKSTSQRAKQDDSPSYIYVNNMTIYDIHLYIDGVNGSNITNLTRGGYAYLVDPGQWRIHNFVYENGYPYARLRGLASESGVFGGLWSPDCAGVYNSLN